MIIDFARPTTPAEMDVDLCIVGAGPAGITLARSFAGTAMTVCLLESGGLDGEPDSQALCRGVSTGLALDPAACRVRTFGGAGNAWGGGCIPLDPADLTQRDWVPHSGWPLSFDALAPYYERALDHCGIGQHRLAPGTFATPPARMPPGFDPDLLVNRTFILSPVFFGEVGREALGQAPNITVLLHANALELETDDTARTVRAARIGTLDGRRGRVHARTWVLACGGIENARLLLLSDAVAPRGLGNDRDLVGRYFMDHPSGSLGRIDGGVPDPLCRPYDRSGGQGATPAFPELGVSPVAARRHRMLAARVRPLAVEAEVPPGLHALRRLRAALHEPSCDEALEGQMKALATESGDMPASPGIGGLALGVAAGLGDVARAVGRRLAGKRVVPTGHVDIVGFFEQAPNRDSRITLDDRLDALGQRCVRVDWQVTPLDWHTWRTTATLAGNALARACGGRFQRVDWLEPDSNATPRLHGTSHHMGTTRMSDDPSTGVVDTDGKVHGVDNLYVAGSSVFPAGGWAFPTFTIVAMSLRLAEHLQRRPDALARAGAGHAAATMPTPAHRPAASPVPPDPIPARTAVPAPGGPSSAPAQ